MPTAQVAWTTSGNPHRVVNKAYYDKLVAKHYVSAALADDGMGSGRGLTRRVQVEWTVFVGGFVALVAIPFQLSKSS